jgi:phage tail sheath protein FI
MLQTQVNTFMAGLFSEGAFAGTSASQAYFVKCDATTTTPADTAAGIVNVQVGFAPLYPAEFVIITISQITASS